MIQVSNDHWIPLSPKYVQQTQTIWPARNSHQDRSAGVQAAFTLDGKIYSLNHDCRDYNRKQVTILYYPAIHDA